MLEWEVTLDCNYQCEYCVNSRNTALVNPIYLEKEKARVFKFIEGLKEKYPQEELFLFGGEPFAHPFFGEIIDKLNEVQMKYIIQTNFSLPKRVEKINEIIQVSVHPTQIKNKELYISELQRLKHLVRKCDVMYTGKESIDYYIKIVKDFPKEKLFLVPVADFLGADFANKYLYEYNKLRSTPMAKFINFEPNDRSFKWEEQMTSKWSPKGSPCMYKDKYNLFDPQLNHYTCSYRQNNDICPNDHCFLM
ncbi:MAG: radical SAM protein [Fluviibacter sp.]